jgi:hypothetical protein
MKRDEEADTASTSQFIGIQYGDGKETGRRREGEGRWRTERDGREKRGRRATGRRREGEGKEEGEGQGRPEVREVRVGRQGARGRAARFDGEETGRRREGDGKETGRRRGGNGKEETGG